MFLWIGFIVCTTAIVYSGIRLSRYGDVIAEKTGLGRTWIGVLLMASVTSLPELVTGISSVTYADVPDIAAGDVRGSCVFNIFILALDDIFFIKGPLLSFTSNNHVISAISAAMMTTIAIIGLTYRAEKKRLIVAWDSACIILVYVLNMLVLYSMR